MKYSISLVLLCIGFLAWSLPAKAGGMFLVQQVLEGRVLQTSFSGSIQIPPDQTPINEDFDLVYTDCVGLSNDGFLDPSCADEFSAFGFYLTHTALVFDPEEQDYLPVETHPENFYQIDSASLSYDAATETVSYDVTVSYAFICEGLGCAVFPTVRMGLYANLESSSSVQLLIQNVDQVDSCGNQSSAFRPQFRIINNSESPLPLNQYSVKMYFQNEAPIQFVNADWVRLFDENGGYAGFGTATPGPDEVLPEDTGCVEPAGGFCGCGVSETHRANQARTIQLTSGAIPPMGHADVIVMYWRGGFVPFDLGCDDFSKLVNLDPSRPFVEDSFFSLFSDDIRVTGLPLSGSVPECSSF